MEKMYIKTNGVVTVSFKYLSIYLTLERGQDNSLKLLCVGTGQVNTEWAAVDQSWQGNREKLIL